MKTEESLFAEASALSAEERGGYLEKACGNDSALRHRLLALLSAHEQCDGILDLQPIPLNAGEDFGAAEGDEIGPFRLLEKIGEGGFGVVFAAEQQTPVLRMVALKIIKPGMDSKEVIARFEAERQALAMMDHPGIARVFDGGNTEMGRPYFVMELVKGVSVTQYCDDHSLSISDRLDVFVSICHAVHHAHQKGIIHRDIKPSNVLVSTHDGAAVVKVIDFGIAKALSKCGNDQSAFTRAGTMVGTLQYMSPEQAEMSDQNVDTRSDVYSLSVVLYELLVGTTPIGSKRASGVSPLKLREMIVKDEPLKPCQRLSDSRDDLVALAQKRGTTPSRIKKKIHGDLEWIVMKGLEKDPDRRYDSAKELAKDVQHALKNQTVLAGPPSLSYRIRKFAVRNRTGLILSAAALLAIAALVFGYVNNQMHLRAAHRKDVNRLNASVDEATSAVIAAADDSNSRELWAAADLLVEQVKDLVGSVHEDELATSRANHFLKRYDEANQHRKFMLSIEELLVNESTQQSVENWHAMEGQFREILKRRGYDVDQLSFETLGEKLKADRKPVQVTDAVELWLATRMKIMDAGGDPVSHDVLRGWTNAMCIGDPDPMRKAIRRIIFRTVDPNSDYLEETVANGDLSQACARKLSWLAEAFELAGKPSRAAQIRQFALNLHPNNLVLNFETAIRRLKTGNAEEATRYLMRCTAIRPELPGVWKTLAVALAGNEEFSEALVALEKYRELACNAGNDVGSESVDDLVKEYRRQVSSKSSN